MIDKAGRIVDKTLTFAVIVSSRLFFNPEYAVGARREILDALGRKGHRAIIGDPALTSDGAVACLADAQKYAALFRERRDEIDGVIVVLANFGDEVAVVETIRLSGLGVPILVQACPDRLDRLDVKGRRDSYCGKISVCNNLYQYGIPWTDTTSHTVDLAADEFAADLEFFGRVCRTAKGLKTARVGSIGTRPAAFQTVRYSEKLLQRSGITVVPIDLSEVFAAADKLPDGDQAVEEKLRKIAAYGSVPSSIGKGKILKQAKFSVVVERWMDENECDASAVQCWNSIQQNYGCASCLTMSMMGEAMRPSACEVDIAGAVSMYALDLASGEPAALLDWNNNYADKTDLVVATHCSNFPKSFMGSPIEVSNLDLLGETFGAENCFGAIKGHVTPGTFTFFRASTDDTEARIKCYGGEGEFTADAFDMNGGIAVCRIANLRNLMGHITREGFEHHVAMSRGSSAKVLREATERYLGWSFSLHG